MKKQYWGFLIPKCDEVIWDAKEGHLAVRYYGTPCSTSGINTDIYDVGEAKMVIDVALSGETPVYVLGEKDAKIRVYNNPIT